MPIALAVVVAVLIIVVLALGGAYAWWNFTGWSAPFAYQTGATPAWTPMKDSKGIPQDISRLRFKGCVFTATRADGVSQSLNVDVVLNSMAVAFKPNVAGGTNPASLNLVTPLNPFSFVIPGFNDKATVPSPSVPLWSITATPAAKVSLTGQVRTI